MDKKLIILNKAEAVSERLLMLGVLIDAQRVMEIISCSRAMIRYYVLTKKLKPFPTIYPKLYFLKSDVELLKTHPDE